MKAVLADTGPLYALADPDDRHHEQARVEAAALESESTSVLLAYPTLLETYTLVVRRLGLELAPAWLDATREGCGLLNPTASDYLHATERIRTLADQPITLFDGVVALLSERLDLPVWTYDHHFDLLRVEVWRP